MNFLLAGIVLFFAMHFLPSLVGLRQNLISRFGEVVYKVLFSVISFFGLILIIYGKAIANFESIWSPPDWAPRVTVVFMVLSFIFLAASGMKSNLSRFTRHPMLWGVALWAFAHLIANGDLASIFLFGSFGFFALLAMVFANKRGVKKENIRYPIFLDVLLLIAGLTVYVIFVVLHPYLFGVSVI